MSDISAPACPIPRLPPASQLAPEIYKKFIAFYEHLRLQGKLELRTKELVRLRVAQLNQCHL